MDQGSRRFVSIIVVVMVLLAGLLATLVFVMDPDDDNGEGWHVEGDSIIVDGNAKWVGWNETLVRPVMISPGASLVIKDSHIEIPLERLIFTSEPGFELSNRGRMEVVNSTISVTKDPRLYKARFDPYEGEISTPAAWRVVNLRGIGSFVDPIDPVLEFSVMMTEGEGHVVAAVQTTPDEVLKPIYVIGPDDVEPMQWKDVRVSLARFIGSTPRVTVFIHDSTAKDVLISNLRITDDGEPLPGDIAMEGRLTQEGWSTGHLYSVMEIFRDWDWWINPLVEGAGDLTVIDSTFKAAPGLDRKWQEYRPQSVGMEGEGPYATVESAPFTGTLNLTGDLTVERSTFSYVPISVGGGDVSVTGASFVGDCELVSIGCAPDSEVSVVDSDFILLEPIEDQQRYTIDEHTWLMAIEGENTRTMIETCNFSGQGTGIGIHVNRGEPVLRDCTFSGLLISIWVHEAGTSMRWGELDPTLDFIDSTEAHYLETREVTVNFEGEGEPAPSDNESGEWNGHYPYIDGMPDIMMMKYQTPHYLIISVPVNIVGPDFREKTVESIEVYIDPSWADYKIVEIDPSITPMTVVFDDSGQEEPDHIAYVYSYNDVGNASGILSQRISLRIDHEYLLSSYLNVTMDGEVIDRVDLVGLGHNITEYREDVYFNHSIPPGPHNLTFDLMGAYLHEENFVELRTYSCLIYRIDGQPEEDVFEWVISDENTGIIMVDEGVKIGDLTYAPDPVPIAFDLAILTWKGSTVTIDRLDASPVYYFAGLDVVGNGTVVIRDLRAPFLQSEIQNCTLVIERLDSSYFDARAWNASISLMGGQVADSNIVSYNGSRIHIEGISVTVDYSITIQCIDSSLFLNDCAFEGTSRSKVRVSGAFDSDLEVRDCSFNGIPLDTRLFEGNNTLRVTGCDFNGEGAYLFVLPSAVYTSDGRDLLETMPSGGSVDGNVFYGPGTGLILFPPYKDVLLGENAFYGEAKAYAFFRPNVTIQGDTDDYTIVTTMDHFKICSAGWIEHRDFEEGWLNYLVDVTEIVENMDDPGLVDVVIVQTSNPYSLRGSIVSFQEIRVADPRSTLPFSDWDYIGDDISRMFNTYGTDVDRWDW